MAQQTINVGAAPNDGTGTPLRTAFQYTNSNFTELYTAVGPSGNNIVVPGTATITGDLTVDTSTLKVDSTNNRVGIGTASPNGPLDVQANTAGTAISIRGRVSANVGTLRWFQNNGTTETAAIDSYDTGFEIRTLTAVPSIFITNSTERYRIASDGVATWSNVGGVASTAMTLNSTGLAIGDSPSYKLHVTASSRAAGANYSTSAMDASAVAYVRGAENDLSKASTILLTQFNGSAAISAGYTATYRSFLAFGVNNGSASVVESMRLDYLGNLGIGVTPSAWTTFNNVKALQFGGGSVYTYANDRFFIGQNVCITAASGDTYVNTATASAYRQYQGIHSWYTAPSGTAGNAITFTQAMTLDASGNLLVGTTGVHLAAHSAFQNNASGQVTFRNTSTTAGRYFNIGMESGSSMIVFNDAGVGVYLGYGTTSWGSTSDEKVKDIIEPISNAVAKVGSLRSVIGKFKTDSEGTRRSFLIAQDVQSVLPEAVDTSNADLLAVRYTEVIPLLVAAIKELTARVQTLEAK